MPKVNVDKDEYWPFYEHVREQDARVSWGCYVVELTEAEIQEWDAAQVVLERIFARIQEQLDE